MTTSQEYPVYDGNDENMMAQRLRCPISCPARCWYFFNLGHHLRISLPAHRIKARILLVIFRLYTTTPLCAYQLSCKGIKFTVYPSTSVISSLSESFFLWSAAVWLFVFLSPCSIGIADKSVQHSLLIALKQFSWQRYNLLNKRFLPFTNNYRYFPGRRLILRFNWCFLRKINTCRRYHHIPPGIPLAESI